MHIENLQQFDQDYRKKIQKAIGLISERQFVDDSANERKNKITQSLTSLSDGITATLEGRRLTVGQTIAMEMASTTLKDARDLLHIWFKPYYDAYRMPDIDIASLQQAGRENWEPVPNQPIRAQEWHTTSEALHEADEVFRGRVLGDDVVSIVPGSV